MRAVLAAVVAVVALLLTAPSAAAEPGSGQPVNTISDKDYAHFVRGTSRAFQRMDSQDVLRRANDAPKQWAAGKQGQN